MNHKHTYKVMQVLQVQFNKSAVNKWELITGFLSTTDGQRAGSAWELLSKQKLNYAYFCEKYQKLNKNNYMCINLSSYALRTQS